MVAPEGLMPYVLKRLLEPYLPRYELVQIPRWYGRQDFDLLAPELALLILDTSQVHYNPRVVQELQRRASAVPVVGLDLHWGIPRAEGYLYEHIITPSSAVEEVEAIFEQCLGQSQGQGVAPLLTRREVEVLRLLVQGKTAREIGDALCISPHTVTTHRKNLSAKLGIQSVAGLAIYAVTRRYIDASELKDLEGGGPREE